VQTSGLFLFRRPVARSPAVFPRWARSHRAAGHNPEAGVVAVCVGLEGVSAPLSASLGPRIYPRVMGASEGTWGARKSDRRVMSGRPWGYGVEASAPPGRLQRASATQSKSRSKRANSTGVSDSAVNVFRSSCATR